MAYLAGGMTFLYGSTMTLSCGYDILLGFTLIGPLFILISNGFSLGIIIDLFIRLSGLKPSTIIILFTSVLPHGIIEIPAFVISATFGILLGLKVFFKNRITPEKSLKLLFFDIAKAYLFIIIPLFLLASFVETFITPEIALNTSSIFSEEENPELEKLVIGKDDVKDLDLRELSLEEYSEISSLSNKLNYLNLIGVLFYDDEIYQEFKKIEDKPQISKVYSSKNPDFTIFIQISKFDSEKEAEKMKNLNQKIFNKTSQEKDLEIEELENGILKITHKDETAYLKLDYKDVYFYSVRSEGEEVGIFESLVEKQEIRLLGN